MPRREVSGNRRNTTATDELVDFQWRRAANGYVVVNVPAERILPSNRDAADLPLGQRYAVESDYDDAGGWSERMLLEQDRAEGGSGVDMERFPMPLDGREPLFLVFASLASPLDRAVAFRTFANQHGLLGRPMRFAMPDGSVARGELVALWERESQAMDTAVKHWQPAADDGGRGAPSWPSDDERLVVQSTINDRISAYGGARARLLWDRASERLALRLTPQTLLGALWLQLAQRVDVGSRFVRCRRCTRWIALHPDSELGRRSQTRTCSERCRRGLYEDSGARKRAPVGLAASMPP